MSILILEIIKKSFSSLCVHFSDIIYMDRKLKSLFWGAVMLISFSSACLQMVCQHRKSQQKMEFVVWKAQMKGIWLVLGKATLTPRPGPSPTNPHPHPFVFYFFFFFVTHMSHVMRKPGFAICEQQRHRSACTFVQSDQHLCCSLPG